MQQKGLSKGRIRIERDVKAACEGRGKEKISRIGQKHRAGKHPHIKTQDTRKRQYKKAGYRKAIRVK